MSSIFITLILIGLVIFAAGVIAAQWYANHKQLRDRLRQALRDAVKR